MSSLPDGLGALRLARDPQHGVVEVRDLTDLLATPAAEQAIRSRVDRFPEVRSCTRVVRIERHGPVLRVIARHVAGVRLSPILAALEDGRLVLPEPRLLDLSVAILRAVAAAHERDTFAHGAISPAHVMLTAEGNVVLTDAMFGPVLEGLQANREQLWRGFGLALPPSASMSRFDQRADVTQVATVVLALLFRRPLTQDEYPRAVPDLASALRVASAHGTALTTWMQQALQLQGRAPFRHAGDAEAAFTRFAGTNHRAAVLAVQRVVRELAEADVVRQQAC